MEEFSQQGYELGDGDKIDVDGHPMSGVSLKEWQHGTPGPYGEDRRYVDDNFVEEHQLQHVNQSTGKDDWMFIFRHKGSQNVFRTVAKDRDELAAKIHAGNYEDADRRNTGFEERNPDPDEDATDE